MCARACMQALPAFSPRSFARALAAVTARASGGQRRDAHTAGPFAGVARACRRGRAVPRSPACPSGSSRRMSRSAAGTGERGLADGADGADGAGAEGETEWQHALDNLQRPSTQELHPGLYTSQPPQPNPANAAPRLQRRQPHAFIPAVVLRACADGQPTPWHRRAFQKRDNGAGGL